jgi:hydroxymethylpyrimidine pyrophosphatase-like HAD family hydrolase
MDTLYISDLDGTLLRNDASLSDYSRRELIALLEEGVQITVASAIWCITSGSQTTG